MHALVEVLVAAAAAADTQVEPDPEIVTPGLLGLVITLLLGVAVFFLYKSMNRQLKRVDFPEQEGAQQQGEAGSRSQEDDETTSAPQ